MRLDRTNKTPLDSGWKKGDTMSDVSVKVLLHLLDGKMQKIYFGYSHVEMLVADRQFLIMSRVPERDPRHPATPLYGKGKPCHRGYSVEQLVGTIRKVTSQFRAPPQFEPHLAACSSCCIPKA